MTASSTGYADAAPGDLEAEDLTPLMNAVQAVSGSRPPCRVEVVGRVAQLRMPLLATGPVGSFWAREGLLQAGAVLFDLRLRLVATGHRPVLWPSAHPSGHPVVVMIRTGGACAATPDERMLLTALDRDQGPLRRIPGISPRLAHHLLRRAAEVEGAALRSVLLESDRDELRSWFPPGRDVSGSAAAEAMVLTTANDLVLTQLAAGQALRRIELTATALGLSVHAAAAPSLSPLRQRTVAPQAAVLVSP